MKMRPGTHLGYWKNGWTKITFGKDFVLAYRCFLLKHPATPPPRWLSVYPTHARIQSLHCCLQLRSSLGAPPFGCMSRAFLTFWIFFFSDSYEFWQSHTNRLCQKIEHFLHILPRDRYYGVWLTRLFALCLPELWLITCSDAKVLPKKWEKRSTMCGTQVVYLGGRNSPVLRAASGMAIRRTHLCPWKGQPAASRMQPSTSRFVVFYIL